MIPCVKQAHDGGRFFPAILGRLELAASFRATWMVPVQRGVDSAWNCLALPAERVNYDDLVAQTGGALTKHSICPDRLLGWNCPCGSKNRLVGRSSAWTNRQGSSSPGPAGWWGRR